MRLTSYTDFSLRVLIYLALHPDRRPTIAEIAGRYGISRAHLMKVVHQLGLAGYIETVRGKNGGLKLAGAALDITVGEVVRRTEPDMALVSCFDAAAAPVCVIAPACRLKGKLNEARAAFLAVLDDCTLAELTGNRSALAGLLGQDPPVPHRPSRRPALAPVFNRVIGDGWDVHLAKMCDFWSSVLLMTGRFKGSPMAAHAAIADIRPTHFARWLYLFTQTARETCPPEAAPLFIAKAEMIGQSLQMGIAVSHDAFPPRPEIRRP